MADVAKNTHYISLQVSGSTEYGFMLAKDGKGQRMWRVGDAPSLNPGYYSTDPTYANQPPLIEMVIPLDEWHVGYGLQDSPRGAEKRYRTSYGADLRQKGRAYNGPASGTLTLPSNFAPTIFNPGFEVVSSGTTLSNWILTSGDGTWAQSAVQKQAGSYSGLSAGGPGAAEVITQVIGDYALFKGIQVTFSCYVYQAFANQVQIRIDDGVGTSTSTNNATTGSWVQISIQRTIDASATKLSFILLNNANASNYFDTATVTRDSGATSTTGDYSRYIDYNSALYLGRGSSLLKYTGSGNWTYVIGFPDVITDMAVMGSQLFVATGFANFMHYSAASSDATWTTATTANNKAQFLCEIGGTLYFNLSASTISNITSANGTAATATTIGLTTTSITGLTNHGGLLAVTKTDQSYLRDSGGGIGSIMPETISETSSTSGKNPLSYKSDLYIQTGTQSLWRWGSKYDVETVSPGRWAVAESDFGGQVWALANDSEYLYAVTDNSTKVEILAMREETIDGDIDWRWHPIAELTSGSCNHAWVSTVGSKRLWICGATGDTPTFIYLPANYADPTTDSTYQRNTSGIFYTPWYSGGFIDVNKAFFSASVLGDNLSATKTITIAYQFPGDTDWTTRVLTVFNAQETQYFATSDVAKKIRFKVTLASDSATTGPVLRGLIIRGVLMPTKLRMFQFTVRAADGLEQRNGVTDKTLGSVLATVLKDCNSATWPVSLRDLDDTLYYVKFQSLDERVTTMDVERRMERHFDVVATETKLS